MSDPRIDPVEMLADALAEAEAQDRRIEVLEQALKDIRACVESPMPLSRSRITGLILTALAGDPR